jgi:hypothetical protein
MKFLIKHMTLDLTPFFIYKGGEQSKESLFADYLGKKIFEGLNNKWAKLLILGLRQIELPHEINKAGVKIIILLKV